MSDIVQKLWGFCHTLRHDGIDYGDYIEQITYLLFLKMADERGIAIPKDRGRSHSVSSIRPMSRFRLTGFLNRDAVLGLLENGDKK
jgi:type I restriction enzyme M protein